MQIFTSKEYTDNTMTMHCIFIPVNVLPFFAGDLRLTFAFTYYKAGYHD